MWVFKAKFMHDPTSLNPIWSSIFIEHQSLSHPHNCFSPRINHGPILSRGFPVPRRGSSIGPEAGGIFSVSEAKEVPLC